jgi:hypothetical protein
VTFAILKTTAIESLNARFSNSMGDILRKDADEKAELISRRLYPLTKDSLGNPGWRKDVRDTI